MNSHKVAVRLAAEQTFRITLPFHPQAEVFTFDSYHCTLCLFIVFLIILLTLASQPSANIPEFRSLADFRSLSAGRKLTFCEHWPFKINLDAKSLKIYYTVGLPDYFQCRDSCF